MLIARRFCGPPDSANGGYTAGLIAKNLQGTGATETPVEVTLRRPPPLERELSLVLADDGARLGDGDLLVAEARLAALDLEPPPAPSFERAQTLSNNYIGHTRHHFPHCFVCGPARAPGDGLRIFPGAPRELGAPGTARAGELVAAPWVPDASIAETDGVIGPELLWAALDCVGYFASAAPDYSVALLGRITAALRGRIRAGEPCVVIGWPLSREGRKLHAGTAIYNRDGTLTGIARQTWILLA